jgi:hypothetical protein
MNGTLQLSRPDFKKSSDPFFRFGSIAVTAFTYPSGVEAIRMENERGHIVLLPYQGQQIWDAEFLGRNLKMQNLFSDPVPTDELLGSYGAFLFHCGARRMGTPGPADDHPLHGELPGTTYSRAWLEFGSRDGRAFVALSGVYHYTRAFGDKYDAVPVVRLFEDSSVLEVEMNVTNLASKPMDLMYMCHVNFAPGRNAEILQGASWTPKDMELRTSIPSHVKPSKEYLDLLESMKENPERTRVIRPEDSYDPEVVFFIRNLKRDDRGWTHMLQKHEDGTADYISYMPERFEHTVRWILIHDDQKVNAMALPSTCGPEGYTREKEKGTVKTLLPGETATFSLSVGAMDSSSASTMARTIEKMK